MAKRKEESPIIDLAAETEAAKLLLSSLADIVADDDTLAADMVEAETGLHEAINRAVELVQQDETHAKAISEHIRTLQQRKARLEHRAELTRTAIGVALDVAKRRKLETPLGVVSVKATPPKLEVIEESQIPSVFWKQPDPTLDKKALTEALKQEGAAPIPGCRLSEPGQTISIRA